MSISIREQIKQAMKYYRLGLTPIPMTPGSPAILFKEFKTTRPTEEQVLRWFAAGKRGFSMLGGNASGGLEALDFDNHNPETASDEEYKAWCDLIPDSIKLKMVVIKTPRDGYRVPWFFDGEEFGQQRLAFRSPSECSIEFHRCHLINFPGGSPFHSTGLPYVWWRPGDIPTFTQSERDLCLDIAKSLSKYTPPPKIELPKTDKTNVPIVKGERYIKPYLDFDANGTWEEILEPLGWTQVSLNKWRRPDKYGKGISATTEYYDGKFYCFSSNCPELKSDTTYTKSALFAILVCGGNFKESNKKLARLGYGLASF